MLKEICRGKCSTRLTTSTLLPLSLAVFRMINFRAKRARTVTTFRDLLCVYRVVGIILYCMYQQSYTIYVICIPSAQDFYVSLFTNNLTLYTLWSLYFCIVFTNNLTLYVGIPCGRCTSVLCVYQQPYTLYVHIAGLHKSFAPCFRGD